jgi:hypothetical protein
MWIYSLLLALTLTASAQQESDPNFVPFKCGNRFDDGLPDLIETHQQLQAQSYVGSPAAWALNARSSTTIVPTAFHIVLSSAQANSVAPLMPLNQLAELNTAYQPTGFQFKLVNLTWTINDTWAAAATPADVLAMQQSLRQGTYDTLNIYFMSGLPNGLLGQCSLPYDIGQNTSPSSYVADGCFVATGSMPNGTIYGYNEGKTAVHETGHFLGLYHPFQGETCLGPGDFISDTPQQSTPTAGCPTDPPKDSCPYQPGFDSIHNYMDYSTDQCYTSFTPDQIVRMQQLWIIYRNGR